MLNSSAVRGSEANWLLLALPDAAYERLIPQLETIDVPFKTVLFEPNVPIEFAYFPQSGCLSVVSVMGDGHTVEIGTIGWEGLVSVSLVHGVESEPARCVAQIGGVSKRLPSAAFIAELRDHAESRLVFHRYAQAWVDQIGRSGTCNATHAIEPRCARWLLLTHDRVGKPELPITHEFLAVMLGVRRASVTVALGALQRAGVIQYKHGRLSIVDRRGLELASCECYTAMRNAYMKLLPIPPSLVPDAPPAIGGKYDIVHGDRHGTTSYR